MAKKGLPSRLDITSKHQIYIKIYTSNSPVTHFDEVLNVMTGVFCGSLSKKIQSNSPAKTTSNLRVEKRQVLLLLVQNHNPLALATNVILCCFFPIRLVCHSWCPGQSAIESLFVCNGKTLLGVVNLLFSWFEKMQRESKTDYLTYLTARMAMGIAKGWK